METTQTLSPPLLAFVLLSLILCIWAIVDIFKSNFTKMGKLIWLLIVLFAPFGVFIYLFIGRRMKLVERTLPSENAADDRGPAGKEPAGPPPDTGIRWPIAATLFGVAIICGATYMHAVSVFGREKTGWFLLSAMIVVGIIIVVLHVGRRKNK